MSTGMSPLAAPCASVGNPSTTASAGNPDDAVPAGDTCAIGGPTWPGPGLLGIPVTDPPVAAGLGNATSDAPSEPASAAVSCLPQAANTMAMQQASVVVIRVMALLVQVHDHEAVVDGGCADAARLQALQQ
jgi:hypothetical protein